MVMTSHNLTLSGKIESKFSEIQESSLSEGLQDGT
jgi:hypothetical protein